MSVVKSSKFVAYDACRDDVRPTAIGGPDVSGEGVLGDDDSTNRTTADMKKRRVAPLMRRQVSCREGDPAAPTVIVHRQVNKSEVLGSAQLMRDEAAGE